MKPIVLNLIGVAERFVEPLDAIRAGRARKQFISHTYNVDSDEFEFDGGECRVVCSGEYAQSDLSYYAKLARKGELFPADEDTAKALQCPILPKMKSKKVEAVTNA